LLGAVVCGASFAPPAGAAPAPEERPIVVTIQAQPRFEGRASRLAADGSFEVIAQLLDDAGAPLSDAEVGVVTTLAKSVAPCNASPARGARRGLAMRTDESGRICARVLGAPREGSVELSFSGSTLHLPAAATIALQPAPSATGLAFESPSLELDLDLDSLRLRLRLSGAAADAADAPIELSLHDGGHTLPLETSEWSRTGELLSFSLDPRSLGLPGPARLVARRAGAEPAARAEAVALRVASVSLSAEVLGEGSGGMGVVVSAASRVGAVPSGWVEARGADGETIGSAPFAAGTARLTLAPPAGAEVTLHYRSDDPWWRPGEPLSLSLGAAPKPDGSPKRWPWLVLLVPIGYICLRSLQRPALRQTQPRPLPKPRGATPIVSPAGAPLISGWVGRVIDAHDGHPVPGAQVELVLPSFRGAATNRVHSVADEAGRFELPALQDPLPEGARLRVWAPLHSDVERPLPPQGRVSIALTSRRRAVLRRLVRWARSLGAPWARGGEPTPGEVADIALRRGDPRTARWAEDVQAAVFGDAPVDAATEASLRAAEPAWHETPSRPKPAED
jgi:hypothetical protein